MNIIGFSNQGLLEKDSARTQILVQLHQRRKQVGRLCKRGIKMMQIVEMTGLSYPPVRAAIDVFEAGGWSALRPALRGRARGDGRVLSQFQEDAVQRMIIDQRPEQLKMDFHLWSRAAVGQLIEQAFGIKLQVRSIGKYLTRWGVTPQKPIQRACEQSPALVQGSGWRVSTLPSESAPQRKEPKFTGVMRPH